MKKVLLSMMVSLDGLIARPDGDLDWFLNDADFESEMLDLLLGVDTILLGRVAYQLLAEYWPTAGTSTSAEAPAGFTSRSRELEFAQLMNAIPKVVFSRTLSTAAWPPTTIVREITPQAIAKLKEQATKDLVLFAGADVASTFVKLDLFDEYRLNVHPMVVARGIPLFKNLSHDRHLKLLRTRAFPSGIVLLHYIRHRAA